MTTYPTITRIELSETVDLSKAEAALAEVFPNATITVGADTGRHIPFAAFAGKWYQADLNSPVYAAIADALNGAR